MGSFAVDWNVQAAFRKLHLINIQYMCAGVCVCVFSITAIVTVQMKCIQINAHSEWASETGDDYDETREQINSKLTTNTKQNKCASHRDNHQACT